MIIYTSILCIIYNARHANPNPSMIQLSKHDNHSLKNV